MGTERKIEALKEATDRKRQEALDKTNGSLVLRVINFNYKFEKQASKRDRKF